MASLKDLVNSSTAWFDSDLSREDSAFGRLPTGNPRTRHSGLVEVSPLTRFANYQRIKTNDGKPPQEHLPAAEEAPTQVFRPAEQFLQPTPIRNFSFGFDLTHMESSISRHSSTDLSPAVASARHSESANFHNPPWPTTNIFTEMDLRNSVSSLGLDAGNHTTAPSRHNTPVAGSSAAGHPDHAVPRSDPFDIDPFSDEEFYPGQAHWYYPQEQRFPSDSPRMPPQAPAALPPAGPPSLLSVARRAGRLDMGRFDNGTFYSNPGSFEAIQEQDLYDDSRSESTQATPSLTGSADDHDDEEVASENQPDDLGLQHLADGLFEIWTSLPTETRHSEAAESVLTIFGPMSCLRSFRPIYTYTTNEVGYNRRTGQ